MIKITLFTSLILILSFSSAFAEVTFSAFTEEGRVLNDEFSIVEKNENFRIIFYSDEKSELNLVLKTKNKIFKDKIPETKQIIELPGKDSNKWLNLSKLVVLQE